MLAKVHLDMGIKIFETEKKLENYQCQLGGDWFNYGMFHLYNRRNCGGIRAEMENMQHVLLSGKSKMKIRSIFFLLFTFIYYFILSNSIHININYDYQSNKLFLKIERQ